MSELLSFLFFVLGPASFIFAAPAPKPAMADLLSASKPSDWRTPNPENLLYMELSGGRVIIELAPDFAVEVISPSETAEEVQEKVRDYLAAGTALVVLAYPRTRLLVAHAPDGSARTYREDETFTAPTVLPGFSCHVAELFT